MKKSEHFSVYNVCRYILKGFTVYRALVYESLAGVLPTLNGEVLDIASGDKPLYHRFLGKDVKLSTGDLKLAEHGRLDMNKPLPFADSSFDHLLCINALYIVKDTEQFFAECYRVLKPGGSFIIVSPFISNEMPDPDDFGRFTVQGLERLCERTYFRVEDITRIGERFTSAMYILHPFFGFSLIRLPFVLLALLGDALIPQSVRSHHPVPLGYLCRVRK